MEIADRAAVEIAGRSRGTPRLANNRLRWVRDYAQSKADGRISLQVARDALTMQGIDSRGLDPQDRRYLETMARVFAGGPVGVEAVAHTMNVAPDTLIDEVEPYLLRSELVVRTPRGRRLTAIAFEHLGLSPIDGPNASGQQNRLIGPTLATSIASQLARQTPLVRQLYGRNHNAGMAVQLPPQQEARGSREIVG